MIYKLQKIIILFKIFLQRGICTNGIGVYATIKHNNPERDMMHTLDRQAEQLSLSKVSFKKSINLDWLYPKKQNKKIASLFLEDQKKALQKNSNRNFFNNYKILIANKIKPILIGSQMIFLSVKNFFKFFPQLKIYVIKQIF